MNRLVGIAVVLVGSLVLAAPAFAALQIVDPADSAELREIMAEATQEQGVCYAWSLNLDDQYTGQGGLQDSGTTATPGGCAKGSVSLTGTVTYSCSTCEGGDFAQVSLQGSGVSIVASSDDYLDMLGLGEDDLLADEGDDVAWLNMVGALPLMVSENNPSVPAPEFDDTIYPADDASPTNTPSALGDWFRTYGWTVAIILLGIGLLAVLGLWVRKQRHLAA